MLIRREGKKKHVEKELGPVINSEKTSAPFRPRSSQVAMIGSRAIPTEFAGNGVITRHKIEFHVFPTHRNGGRGGGML